MQAENQSLKDLNNNSHGLQPMQYVGVCYKQNTNVGSTNILQAVNSPKPKSSLPFANNQTVNNPLTLQP